MAIKFDREAYNKVFNDLEEYKEFCARAWTLGFKESFVFNEKHLYKMESREWRAFQNWKKFGKPPRYGKGKK